MFKMRIQISICLIFTWLICLRGLLVFAQEPVHTELQDQVHSQVQEGKFTLVDFVNVAAAFQDIPDTLCTMEFLEEWNILPLDRTLLKEVLDQDTSCISLLLSLPKNKGSITLRKLSYEFMLLDPHLIASGNTAFPEPDSMDVATRRLQGDLIDLIKNLSRTASQFPLEDQLLSVIFHEDWFLDPGSRRITKEVLGITPVIWQRRQTVSGEPVNDGETGLPVYFKMQLEQINLRNP